MRSLGLFKRPSFGIFFRLKAALFGQRCSVPPPLSQPTRLGHPLFKHDGTGVRVRFVDSGVLGRLFFFFLARAVAYSVRTALRSVFSRNKLLWFSSLSFSLVQRVSSFVSRPGLRASDCAVRESACSKSQTRVLLCFAVYSSKVQPLIRLCLVLKLGLLS